MGPKKKGGGDGSKGGKGKASKLAKMNEQERTRYLERKMAEEEETKRRKEEMINVFLKMKLNKEERNSGLNTSKLIDRWRGIRREAKSKELIQDVTVLQETFERALMRKNRHIELLLQDLEESEEQYNMCVRSQIDAHCTMDMIHSARLKDLVEIHVKEREEIKLKSVNEQQASAKRAEESGLYLDDVIIALEQRHTAAEQEIKTEYQQTHEEVRNKNLEEKQALQLYLEETLEGLWQKLQDEVSSFNSSTEEKRRIYNDLLTKDKRGVAEVADNNKKIQKLLEDMAKLKEALTELGLDEDKRLSGLRAERDELTKELHATRRAVSVDYRNREEMGLRKLAAQTDQVEKFLDQACHRHEQMMRISESCIKYETEEDEMVESRIATFAAVTDDEKAYLKRVDRLRGGNAAASASGDVQLPDFKHLAPIQRRYNRASIDVSALRRERRTLVKENDELKEMLREYFKSLAVSKDLAQLGLLSIQKKEKPPHLKKGRRRLRPKSSPARQ